MADPFSTVGCVLGILSSLGAISKAVKSKVDNVKGTSHEIRCLSRDIHAFFPLVRSLDIALRDRDVRDVVERDGAILFQICDLKESLRNCRDVLTQLMVKHEKFQQKGNSTRFRKLR